MKVSATDITEGTRALRQGGWLSRTPAAFQDAVLGCCLWQHVAPSSALTHGGDPKGGMYGIARGTVDITSAVGPADLGVIHIACAPYWFGLLPVVSQQPRAVSITSRGACLAAIVPEATLAVLLAEQPAWWRLLAVQALEHFSTVTQVASDLHIPDSRRRCIAVLLRVAGCGAGGAASGVAGISQNELAAMSNMSRQTVSEVLRQLAEVATITLGYRSIAVNDAAALRAILDG